MDEFLSIHHLSKRFPGVVALDDVTMSFRRGEVHAIVGENGAGKSTLIKALSGAHPPTDGQLVVEGEPYGQLSPGQARDLGIAVIYQEFTLVPVLSVAENIYLGDYPTHYGVLDRRSMIQMSAALFERLGVDVDPRSIVQNLTTGYQQIVEIAKALARNASVLIMDEPSAPLTTSEVSALFKVVKTLKAQGVTILYISHRLEEIFELSDRVSVLRDGKHVATLDTRHTTETELIKLMVGRDLVETYPPRAAEPASVGLEVTDLSGNGVHGISFSARRGEILGFGGLVGAGRTELMQMLFGAAPIESGTITIDGIPVRPRNTVAAIKAGIAMVPEDRKKHGVLVELAIRFNIVLPIIKRISSFGVVRRVRERGVVEQYMQALQIKAPSAAQRVKNLSGGNQQKIVLAKWLATDPDVIIFDEPTRGIDVGAKQEIYSIMNDLASQGRVILMISSDMEELLGMSDRLVILCRGQQAGTLTQEEFSQEKILELSSGV